MTRSADALRKQIRSILQGPLDRKEKASHVVSLIRDLGPFRWVGLYNVDLSRREVSNIAWSGNEAPCFPIFPSSQGITSRAITSKRTVNVGKVANDAAYLTAMGDTQSEIIVPILSRQGEVIGTLDIESDQENAFDVEIEKILELLVEDLPGLVLMEPLAG